VAGRARSRHRCSRNFALFPWKTVTQEHPSTGLERQGCRARARAAGGTDRPSSIGRPHGGSRRATRRRHLSAHEAEPRDRPPFAFDPRMMRMDERSAARGQDPQPDAESELSRLGEDPARTVIFVTQRARGGLSRRAGRVMTAARPGPHSRPRGHGSTRTTRSVHRTKCSSTRSREVWPGSARAVKALEKTAMHPPRWDNLAP